ncbi:hypothetical protein BS78_03G413100 [Paspalum vaginatum]|nr:hypothetical protein BS78_03G413100 [Paspalum vaginatum]
MLMDLSASTLILGVGMKHRFGNSVLTVLVLQSVYSEALQSKKNWDGKITKILFSSMELHTSSIRIRVVASWL